MRTQQIHQEVRWALWLTVFYIIGWAGCAYLLPNSKGMFGFPIWFEMACIYVPLCFIVAITWVVRCYFHHIPLEEHEDEE